MSSCEGRDSRAVSLRRNTEFLQSRRDRNQLGATNFHFATCDVVWKTAPALPLLHSTASGLRAASDLLGFYTSAAQNTPGFALFTCVAFLFRTKAGRGLQARGRGRPEALREARAQALGGAASAPGVLCRAAARARPKPRGSHEVRRVRRPLVPGGAAVGRPLGTVGGRLRGGGGGKPPPCSAARWTTACGC